MIEYALMIKLLTLVVWVWDTSLREMLIETIVLRLCVVYAIMVNLDVFFTKHIITTYHQTIKHKKCCTSATVNSKFDIYFTRLCDI